MRACDLTPRDQKWTTGAGGFVPDVSWLTLRDCWRADAIAGSRAPDMVDGTLFFYTVGEEVSD